MTFTLCTEAPQSVTLYGVMVNAESGLWPPLGRAQRPDRWAPSKDDAIARRADASVAQAWDSPAADIHRN